MRTFSRSLLCHSIFIYFFINLVEGISEEQHLYSVNSFGFVFIANFLYNQNEVEKIINI